MDYLLKTEASDLLVCGFAAGEDNRVGWSDESGGLEEFARDEAR